MSYSPSYTQVNSSSAHSPYALQTHALLPLTCTYKERESACLIPILYPIIIKLYVELGSCKSYLIPQTKYKDGIIHLAAC